MGCCRKSCQGRIGLSLSEGACPTHRRRTPHPKPFSNLPAESRQNVIMETTYVVAAWTQHEASQSLSRSYLKSKVSTAIPQVCRKRYQNLFPLTRWRPKLDNWIGHRPPLMEVGWLSCNDNPLSTAEAAASGSMLTVLTMKMIDDGVDGGVRFVETGAGWPCVSSMCICKAAAVGPCCCKSPLGFDIVVLVGLQAWGLMSRFRVFCAKRSLGLV